jgi:hypothetical protein
MANYAVIEKLSAVLSNLRVMCELLQYLAGKHRVTFILLGWGKMSIGC